MTAFGPLWCLSCGWLSAFATPPQIRGNVNAIKTAVHVLLRSSGLISLPPHLDSLTPKLAPANVTTVLDPVYKPRRDISFKRLMFAG